MATFRFGDTNGLSSKVRTVVWWFINKGSGIIACAHASFAYFGANPLKSARTSLDATYQVEAVVLCDCGITDVCRTVLKGARSLVTGIYQFLQKAVDPVRVSLMTASVVLLVSPSFAQTAESRAFHKPHPGIGRLVIRQDTGLSLLNAAIASLGQKAPGAVEPSLELKGRRTLARTGEESSFIWLYDPGQKPLQPDAELEVDGSRPHKAAPTELLNKGVSRDIYANVSLASPARYFTQVVQDAAVSIQYRGKIVIDGKVSELVELCYPEGSVEAPPLRQRWFFDQGTGRPWRVEMDVYGAIAPSIMSMKRYDFLDPLDSSGITIFRTIKLYHQSNLFATYYIDAANILPGLTQGGSK